MFLIWPTVSDTNDIICDTTASEVMISQQDRNV